MAAAIDSQEMPPEVSKLLSRKSNYDIVILINGHGELYGSLRRQVAFCLLICN
jgi:hypothetical protein